MLEIVQATRFKRDVKRCRKQGKDLAELQTLVRMLAREETLPLKYKNHLLSGEFASYSECHIRPDWLLIYKVSECDLHLIRTGSHSELFK